MAEGPAQLHNSRWQGGSEHGSAPKILQNSIPGLFFAQAAANPLKIFSRYRQFGDDSWVINRWSDVAQQVTLVANFLLQHGVNKGDRVAILSSTRHEWLVADLAILAVGAVSTPIYQTSTAEEAGYILWDSGATVVFVENQEQLEKIRYLAGNKITVPASDDVAGGEIAITVTCVVTFESPKNSSDPELTGEVSIDNLPEIVSRQLHSKNRAKISELVAALRRDDLASIVYTSGTTGVYKGVMQTHGNHLAMLDGAVASGLLGDGSGIFLFLPLAHSFARLIGYVILPNCGDLIFPTVVSKTSSQFNAKRLFEDIRCSNPKIFPSVPRIFEKLMSTLGSAGAGSLKSRVTASAICSYQRLAPLAAQGELHGLADRIRYLISHFMVRKIRRAVFGNGFRYAISGGAPLSIDTHRFFDSIGIKIFEGYGLTETCPALTANTELFCKPGTVGRPFPTVQLRIAQDGEILAAGDNIALGYWRRPKATAEAWLAGGWFATGDIGEVDSDGFLKITDRKKELIVNAGGKKIAPALLEGRLKSSPYISQALVFGDRKPYLVALVTLELPNVIEWDRKRGHVERSAAELAADPEVNRLIADAVSGANRGLANYEQVRRFAVLAEDFTVDNGLLSPTLKLRRKAVTTHYAAQIEELYNQLF